MLAAIEQRLTAWRTQDDQAAFTFVGSAMTVAAAFEEGLKRPLELYVVPLPSSYQRASQDLGPISQQGIEQFAIAVGIKTYNDARGKSGNAQLDSLKKELIRCLVGWQPLGAIERVELQGSEPLGVKKDNFWFICRFRYAAWLQQD